MSEVSERLRQAREKSKKRKIGMEIENCRNDCYCEPKKATHSASPPPPALDLELLQRFARLRDNGKFLDLEIKCSDGATRSVHKFVLNSLSVKLGRSILACKYRLNYILHINLLARVSTESYKSTMYLFLLS